MKPIPSRLIRRTHMYVALFLMPWMIIYALSGLVLNHFPTIRAWYGGSVGQFEKVGERTYSTAFSNDAEPRMIAAQILDDLGLSGPFNVQPGSNQARMIINRGGAFSAHRITYFRAENRLLLEQQKFTAPVFVNRAHFRAGYEQPFVSSKIWAALVDLVVLGMLFWVVSGVLMWWEIKPARGSGAVFALVGFGAFGLLLATI